MLRQPQDLAQPISLLIYPLPPIDPSSAYGITIIPPPPLLLFHLGTLFGRIKHLSYHKWNKLCTQNGYLLNILPSEEKTRSGERTRESLVLLLEDKTKLRLNE